MRLLCDMNDSSCGHLSRLGHVPFRCQEPSGRLMRLARGRINDGRGPVGRHRDGPLSPLTDPTLLMMKGTQVSVLN
jgi:hypothetical protein